MTTLPVARKSGRGGLVRLLLVFLLCIVVVAGVMAITAPWGFFMGGRFHLVPQWQGWGRLHSDNAGGDYALYLSFSPKTGKGLGPAHVSGIALLCTPRGEKLNLTMGGDFEKNIRLDTNGKKASFYMSSHTIKSQLSGNDWPHLELRGKWNNPDLVLDDHGSIARNFDRNATLYATHASIPYMTEVSPVTLHEGGKQDFDAACAAVKKSP